MPAKEDSKKREKEDSAKKDATASTPKKDKEEKNKKDDSKASSASPSTTPNGSKTENKDGKGGKAASKRNSTSNANGTANGAQNSASLKPEEREKLTTEYNTMRKELKELIGKKRTLDKALNSLEEQVYTTEGNYLEDTHNVNVVKGLEGYLKTNLNKRRVTVTEQDRIFSRSSAVFLRVKMREEESNV